MTFQTDQIHFKTCDPFLRTVKIIENHSNNNWKILIERSIRVRHSIRWTGSYSSSHNLTPAISRALIGRYLIFCSPTWPTCCNSSRKCTPVKYKAREKSGFPTVTQTTSDFWYQVQILSVLSERNNGFGKDGNSTHYLASRKYIWSNFRTYSKSLKTQSKSQVFWT